MFFFVTFLIFAIGSRLLWQIVRMCGISGRRIWRIFGSICFYLTVRLFPVLLLNDTLFRIVWIELIVFRRASFGTSNTWFILRGPRSFSLGVSLSKNGTVLSRCQALHWGRFSVGGAAWHDFGKCISFSLYDDGLVTFIEGGLYNHLPGRFLFTVFVIVHCLNGPVRIKCDCDYER